MQEVASVSRNEACEREADDARRHRSDHRQRERDGPRSKLAHIFPSADITTPRPYTTPGTPRDRLKPKKYPKRLDPAAHARSLLQQIQTITNGTGGLAEESYATRELRAQVSLELFPRTAGFGSD